MPLCTLHLLSLNVPIPHFLHALSSTRIQPLITAKVIRWIILPTKISTTTLLAQNTHWDILLILPTTAALPPTLRSLTTHQFRLDAGVPSRLVQNFAEKNRSLLRPNPNDVPPLTTSLDKPRITPSAQSLELSSELLRWAEDFGNTAEGAGAVSMLNLLAFKPGLKKEYLKYGAAFAESVGARRGGVAKIVGSVVHGKEEGEGNGEGWDEVALAHYPSVKHFADMLASEDYQEANHKYRVGSLRDTCILCTSELAVEQDQGGLWRKGMGSKL